MKVQLKTLSIMLLNHTFFKLYSVISPFSNKKCGTFKSQISIHFPVLGELRNMQTDVLC